MTRRATNKNRRTAVALTLLVGAMAGLSFASVPLYRLFCQATGFGGTTRIADRPASQPIDRVVSVRFDSQVNPGLPWRFEPVQGRIDVRLGENILVFYRATNLSRETVTGSATFNVVPEKAGPYFYKLECFCFTEQTLAPGETVEMPVSFYIDAEWIKDRKMASLDSITLSYSFFRVERPGIGENSAVVPPRASLN